jgi:1,4-alpha-glucan branching enzyme
MGNEFGHPEWIDFPREGNGWSFHYCRRQWSLLENGFLKYQWLGEFDRDVVHLIKENRIFDQRMGDLRLLKDPEKTLVFTRNGLMFAFNFHSSQSLENVLVPVVNGNDYELVLSSDDEVYGGQGNVKHMTYHAKQFDKQWYVELYLPARTAVILKEVPAPVKKRPGRPKKVKTEETEKPKKVSKPRKKKTEA